MWSQMKLLGRLTRVLWRLVGQDYQFLYDQGVGAIFGPGTRLPAAASETLKAIYKKLEENKAKGI